MNLKAFMTVAALFVGGVAAENYQKVTKTWGGTNIETYVYSVGTCGGNETLVKAAGRGTANIRVNGAFTVYIGSDAANLSTTGYPLFANESINMDAMSAPIYACGASSPDIRVLEGVR